MKTLLTRSYSRGGNLKFLVPFLVRVLRTEARLFTAQLSTWLVPRALFSKAARQAEGCAAFTPMRGPWRRNRTWCPCGVLGNHAFVCISTLLCPLPPPRHVCILSSSTFPSVWRRRFNFLPSYLIIPIVSNFSLSLISSLILDFGFWIFSQICFFSSLSRFFEFFLSILIFILFYYFISIYLFYFIYILIFIVYSCSIPQSVLIVDFSFIIVSILLFYFSVNLSLEIFRFLLFVAIFVVASLIDYFFFVLSSHFYCFSVSFFLSFFSPLLSFSSYFPRHAI